MNTEVGCIAPARPSISMAAQERWFDSCRKIIESGVFTNGRFTRLFEDAVSAFHGIRRGVAVSSATAGLKCVLDCIKHDGRRKVAVPVNTFFATASAVCHSGFEPVFVDCDPETGNVSFAEMLKVIDDNRDSLAAAIVVHIGGVLIEPMMLLRSLCDDSGITLIEDAAHATGCKFANGRGPGCYSHSAVLSFFPTKTITTGEGGMILTNSDTRADEYLVMRDHGKEHSGLNYHTKMGFNWRMSEFAAAMGLAQMFEIDEILLARQVVADIYMNACKSGPVPVKVLSCPSQSLKNWYKFTVLLENAEIKKEVERYMRDNGVMPSGLVYDRPLHMQPALDAFYEEESSAFPGANSFCSRHLCLPLFTDMTTSEMNKVACVFFDALGRTWD